MVSDDGRFELEFTDDGVPGIVLPVVTVVRGRLSPAAVRQFASIVRNNSPEQSEMRLRAAVKHRWRITGLRAGEIVVKTTDFEAWCAAGNHNVENTVISARSRSAP